MSQQTLSPDVVLPLSAHRPVVGLDIGGTTVKYGLVDAAGRILEFKSAPTDASSPDHLADQIAGIVQGLGRQFPDSAPQAVGVLVPGLVDDERGLILEATNLHLVDVHLRSLVERRTGLPVGFANDARGAGRAEFDLGAAAGHRSAVIVSIGTGIGAAVYLDGRSYDADGFGCELGHMRMVLDSGPEIPVCPCGGHGCLETYASARGIADLYARATGLPLGRSEAVFAAAASGEPVAQHVITQAIDMLALAFAQVATMMAPEVIVVAGGLSRAGDSLFRPLRARLSGLLTFQRLPLVVPGRFGHRAGLVASALVADDHLVSDNHRRLRPGADA